MGPTWSYLGILVSAWWLVKLHFKYMLAWHVGILPIYGWTLKHIDPTFDLENGTKYSRTLRGQPYLIDKESEPADISLNAGEHSQTLELLSFHIHGA